MLQRGGLYLLARAPGEPALSVLEVRAAQQVAAVFALCLPLLRAHVQASVRVHPIEICVHGVDQGFDSGFEIVIFAEEDVVAPGELGRDSGVGRLQVAEGNQPLPGGDGVLQFLAARAGGDGVGTENEQEVVGRIDTQRNLRQPFGGGGNVVLVEPHFLIRGHEGGNQL